MSLFKSKYYWISLIFVIIICMIPMTSMWGGIKGLLCLIIFLLGKLAGIESERKKSDY